jgi:hypothetical protein
MSQSREDILEERRRLKAEYRQLYDELESLLFRHDPVGINFDDNTEEYEPEVSTILPKLKTCASADDVCRVVHEEFVRWFDASTAGKPERYAAIGREIWQLWQRFRNAEASAEGNAK